MGVNNGCGFTDHKFPVMSLPMTMFFGYVAPEISKILPFVRFFFLTVPLILFLPFLYGNVRYALPELQLV
jgi:hypothetical protein